VTRVRIPHALYVANLLRVRGNLYVYTVIQNYKPITMLALRHGPCPRIKSRYCQSDITIIKRGVPRRMKYVDNKRLVPLAEYLQQRKALT